jgi:hypothetical protein
VSREPRYLGQSIPTAARESRHKSTCGRQSPGWRRIHCDCSTRKLPVKRQTSEPIVRKLPIWPPARACPAHSPSMNSWRVRAPVPRSTSDRSRGACASRFRQGRSCLPQNRRPAVGIQEHEQVAARLVPATLAGLDQPFVWLVNHRTPGIARATAPVRSVLALLMTRISSGARVCASSKYRHVAMKVSSLWAQTITVTVNRDRSLHAGHDSAVTAP